MRACVCFAYVTTTLHWRLGSWWEGDNQLSGVLWHQTGIANAEHWQSGGSGHVCKRRSCARAYNLCWTNRCSRHWGVCVCVWVLCVLCAHAIDAGALRWICRLKAKTYSALVCASDRATACDDDDTTLVICGDPVISVGIRLRAARVWCGVVRVCACVCVCGVRARAAVLRESFTQTQKPCTVVGGRPTGASVAYFMQNVCALLTLWYDHT